MSALALVVVAACGSVSDGGAQGHAEGGADATNVVGADAGADAANIVGVDAGADATNIVDAAADVNPLCTVTDTYTFGFVGGLVASSDESVLSPPSQYHHVRTYYRSDGGTTTCAPAPDCQVMNSLGLMEVVVGFQNADVRAALSQPTPPLYGHDSRPVDGRVYSIMRSDGRGMLVGTACTGQMDCRAIPGGIGNLVLALQMFDERMLGKPECSGL
jgi:hypothetical protein